jgi:nifR3 family TIM-barrel protein
MEDVSNLAFRLIAKRIGQPGLMFTEFVSAMAIHYNASKTLKKLRVHQDERPLGIQIFGADPEIMANTAKLAEEMGADIVDINMGCWVPKVCKTGSGAALLKDPDTAEKIVQAVVKAVKVPVTVKVRAGWDYSLFAAPELAKRFQGAGIQMLTLHARFAKQGFEGEADWKLIHDLRKSVTIPLIGNGDVKTPEDAVRMMSETGCDGVMVGRAAISNPWALARISARLRGLEAPAEPTIQDRIQTATEHARLMIAYEAGLDSFEEAKDAHDYPQTEIRALRALRGQLPLYIKGEPGASQVRGRLSRVSSLPELETILQDFMELRQKADPEPCPA